MCDYFLQRTESDQHAGDLTDIVRASSAAMPVSAADDLPSTPTGWLQLPTEPILFPPPQSSSDGAGPRGDAFVDPFSGGVPDPFSSDYPSSSGSAADFFDTFQDAMDVGVPKVGFVDAAEGGGGRTAGAGMVLEMRNHVFQREIQVAGVSTLSSPRAMGSFSVKLDMPMAGQAVGPCTFDAATGLHMSSPRAGGIKRRKSLARKVVCIPAPAAAVAGRTTGEVVPSDLWAWRKYGQKPIKGSPYPRGYYKCSSSKGCPARKQVERSRSDPNMLVITYTSEHNHPWPTQRNVLAGSTRSHYAKNSSCNSSAPAKASSRSSSSRSQQQKPTVEEEPAKTHDVRQATAAATATNTTATTSMSSTSPMTVKEEGVVVVGSIGGGTSVTMDYHSDDLIQQMFSQSYRPMIPEAGGGGHYDDLFADLTELESDPISLIFSTEYMETSRQCLIDIDLAGKEKAIGKDLDPLMLDWAPTTAAVTSFCREHI